MISISKNSWHYKFIKFVLSEYPSDIFLTYCIQLLSSLFIVSFVTVILTTIISLFIVGAIQFPLVFFISDYRIEDVSDFSSIGITVFLLFMSFAILRTINKMIKSCIFSTKRSWLKSVQSKNESLKDKLYPKINFIDE